MIRKYKIISLDEIKKFLEYDIQFKKKGYFLFILIY